MATITEPAEAAVSDSKPAEDKLPDALLEIDYDALLERIGPTWQVDPETGNYKIPERTLGWAALAWIMEHMQSGQPGQKGMPFMPTPEQGRMILWWYALNPDGTFMYDEAQWQRSKGHGKDPLLTLLCAFEALGPCRFDGWQDEEQTIPKATEVSLPLVQVIATTQDQTQTTLRLFRHYFTEEALKKYKIEINTEAVKSHGVIVIQAVTSNPEALEGKSPTFVLLNEVQHFYTRIALEMYNVTQRNSTKVAGGSSRMLAITNAFDPSMGSVGENTRKLYEDQLAKFGASNLMYDSLEIAPTAPLFIFEKDENGENTREVDMAATRVHLAKLVKLAYGDSYWAPVPKIVERFFDTRVPPDHNRRFWLNTIVSSEDNWIDIRDFDKCVNNTRDAKKEPRPGDAIALFFDGSKNSDSTVLMAARISDGYVFKLGAWHKPANGEGPAGTVWRVPRNEADKRRYDFKGGKYPNPYRNIPTVDEIVEKAFRVYNVVGFYADPGHLRDEESVEEYKMYWDTAIENWHILYSSKLKLWAGNARGSKSQSILWDMQDPKKIEEFAERAEITAEAIVRGELLIADDGDIRVHFKNAKVYKTRSGLESIWKGRRNSDKKIDLAVASIGALHVRAQYLKQFGNLQTKYSPYSRF